MADGTIQTVDVAQFQEAEDVWDTGDDGVEVLDQQGRWSGNRAIELTGGTNPDTISFVWQVETAVTQGDAKVVFVLSVPDTPTPGIEYSFDGTQIEDIGSGAFSQSNDQFDLRTYTSLELNPDGELPIGNYQLDLTVTGGEDARLLLDFIHFRDTRFSYNEDTEPTDGVVTGWESKPYAFRVNFEPVSSVEPVTGGRLEVVMDDISNGQALHIRNDTSGDWITEHNTDTLDVEFTESGQEIQAGVTISRYDSGTESGQYGDISQVLDSFELRADLVDTPVLLDKSYHGNMVDILNKIADAGDFIWEVRRDENGEYVVEWTEAGQRTTERELDYVEYSGRHTIEGSYERAIVFGASETILDERFTVTQGFGLLLGLDENWIVPSSETVYDPILETEFTRGTDYNMRWQEGAIELLSGGNMSLDTEYAIDYDRKTRGEYTLPSAGSDPRTIEEEFPVASTDRECGQLALGLVKRLQDPLEEVTATISGWNPKWPLVEALDNDQLPFDGPLVVREVDQQGGQVTMRLGTRQTVEEAVQDLRDQLEAVSSRV